MFSRKSFQPSKQIQMAMVICDGFVKGDYYASHAHVFSPGKLGMLFFSEPFKNRKRGGCYFLLRDSVLLFLRALDVDAELHGLVNSV